MANLMRAIINRHDCVHRNGHNKDGEKLTVFSPRYIEEIAGDVHALVDAIEKARMLGGFQAAISAAGRATS
jgi:hypothetical protein